MPEPTWSDELLRLYATNRVDKISGLQKFQTFCQQNEKQPLFKAHRVRIEKAKRKLEVWLEPESEEDNEVEQAISVLLGERHQLANRNLYYQLITLGYRPNWSDAQRKYFDLIWQRIRLKYDFFLSFTTRHEEVAGDNPVNSNYRYFIQHVLGVTEFENADRRKKNLLAQCVHRYLARTPMEPFFYPHSENDNAVVDPKLAEACANSRVFVQLVQNIMFTPPKERKNYCFFEYEKVNQLLQGTADKERLILFVIAEKEGKLVPRPLVPTEYWPWHKHVSSKAAPYLSAVDLENKANRIEDLQRCLEKLHTQIEGELLRLATEAPKF